MRVPCQLPGVYRARPNGGKASSSRQAVIPHLRYRGGLFSGTREEAQCCFGTFGGNSLLCNFFCDEGPGPGWRSWGRA